jgi:hypothetical protein
MRAAGPPIQMITRTLKRCLGRWGAALLVLSFGSCDTMAGKLDPSNWIIYNYSGPLVATLTNGIPLPPSGLHVLTSLSPTNIGQIIQTNGPGSPLAALNQLTNLTDQNLGTFVTLSNPSVVLMDMGQTNVLDRVYLVGSTKPTNLWYNYSASAGNPPLGLIVVYVGNTVTNTNQVATYTVPYDAGNPVETEADIRFSPAAGRYVRLELHTQVTWGKNYWPGFALSSQPTATNVSWNLGELELYGFSGAAAAETNVNAVVLPAGAAAPLALAASDLSYYLGELTGLPHPIIPPQNSNQYSGTLYQIMDLASLAPNYNTMMSNISNGQLPTNINVSASGRMVVFKSWPYRCVLWSVWEFLERQGIRWVYPDAHGDYVPANGLNPAVVPFQYQPATFSIYANFDINPLEPWPIYQMQSVRQEYLYPWRNRWTCSENGYGPLGGAEIPALPAPNVVVNSNYTEGFLGYPHNFSSVVPNRILDIYTNWWGWSSTNPGSQVAPETSGTPVFAMDNPALISWVANKMTNIAAAQPLACAWPLNLCHWHRSFNLLPLDASVYSQDPYTIASNSPTVPDPVPWVKEYGISYSGMYYSFVTSVARQVQQMGSSALVGALAYADVFLPPTNIPALIRFPTNVQVEVCLYGAPNLPMTAPANAGMKAALDGWHATCSHLATYDYALLHTDYEQQDPRMPVALIAGTLARSQYIASIGAADGGCQGNLSSLPYNPWNFYAYPRTRWNTNQTAAQLEQEFFTGYFREAAAPMLAYYQAMENYQVSNNVDLYYLGYCYAMTPGSFPIGILAQMQTNLLQAEHLVTNWWVADRVADIAAGFGWLITNSPDGLVGVNLNDTSRYAVLSASTNTTSLNLAAMAPTANMVFGNNAYPSGPGWWMSSPAQIQQSYNMTAGTCRLDIVARGASASGIWPIMNVYLGPDSGSTIINTTNDSTYSFTFTVPTGVFDLVIAFPNSNLGNFNIDSIKITYL